MVSFILRDFNFEIMSLFKFSLKYFLLTLLLLGTEICIALFVDDHFIRPFVGDYLVVILIYTLIKSFFNFSVLKTAFGVLIFSFVIEFLQYLELVSFLGLEKNTFARIIIGTSFSWYDLICYTSGILTVLFIEQKMAKIKSADSKLII